MQPQIFTPISCKSWDRQPDKNFLVPLSLQSVNHLPFRKLLIVVHFECKFFVVLLCDQQSAFKDTLSSILQSTATYKHFVDNGKGLMSAVSFFIFCLFTRLSLDWIECTRTPLEQRLTFFFLDDYCQKQSLGASLGVNFMIWRKSLPKALSTSRSGILRRKAEGKLSKLWRTFAKKMWTEVSISRRELNI